MNTNLTTSENTAVVRWNPWPWAIVIWFICFFGVVVGMTVTAARSRSDVVAADYYAQELKFQDRIDAAGRTDSMSEPPQVTYDSKSRVLRIQLPSGAKVSGGKVALYRPDDARLDQDLPMVLDATGSQVISTDGLKVGRWRIRLSWTLDGKEYYHEATVRLKPGV